MTPDLAGRLALVVGFGNALGARIAVALAEAGADVAVASATPDGDEVMAAKRAARDAAKLGRRAFAQGWDVTLPTNVQVGVKQLAKELGRPTVLVLNIDAPLARTFEKTSDSELGRVLQVNLAGAFYAARSFVRELPDEAPGTIVFVVPADDGGVGAAAYAAARGGVRALAAALAEELAGRVTVICLTLAAGDPDAGGRVVAAVAGPDV